MGQLQPHQGQSGPQISQSSSTSDVTSGQPCSFKLSEQTTHADALHAPVDDNEQRSVQTLMASMSPKAKNNQFPLGSVSALVNIRLFEGDSLPASYSLTDLTRSTSEHFLLRGHSDADYANRGSDHAESSFGTTDRTNETEENDSVRTMVTSEVEPLDVATEQMAERRDEKNGSPFLSLVTGRSEHHANNTDEISSLFIMQTEKPGVKSTNENNQNDPINANGNSETNNTVTRTLKNNPLSQLKGTIEFAVHSTHKIEQAVTEDFVNVMNDFATPAHDTNNRTGSTAFIKSDSLPEVPKLQVNDVPISDMKHHAAETTERQNNPSTLRGTVSDSSQHAPHFNFRSELPVLNKSTQQTADRIMNLTSLFQIRTAKNIDFVSLAPTADLIVSTEDHELLLTTSERVPVVIEKSSQVAHAEHMGQSNSHIEPLSLRKPPMTPTTGKLPPAGKRKNTTEAPSVEQHEHEISVQGTEQSQHALSALIAITRPSNDLKQSVQTGLLKTSTMVKGGEYSSFQDIKRALITNSAFEAKSPLTEKMSAAHTRDRTEHKYILPEETSISQMVFGAMTESVPPTEIKSGETTKTTVAASEIDHNRKMYKTQSGNKGREKQTLDKKPENGNCSSDSRVPGKAAPQATFIDYASLSPITSKSYQDHTSVDSTSIKAKNIKDKTVHMRHWTPEQAQILEKTTQRRFHRETSETQEATATGVTLSEPEATATIQITERTLLTEKNKITQLNQGGGKAEIFEAQNATRSVRAVAKEEVAAPESGHRMLLPELQPESELPRLKQKRTSPHLYLSGVTEVSDDLCGSGNYTAEMSLNLGRGVEPGDPVPALGNLRVVINLKTNNSQLNLEVTSCCLSPTIAPDPSNSTCCLFSRLAAEPAGITLLPSDLSTSASFTISLFQMINYSVVYLHCDLSVCLRNHSDCERQCLQQRSAFSLEGPEAIVTNLRNRISFGPMLKQMKNSTFPKEIDPSELDLVLVIISLVVGCSLVTVMLLLVWVAYRHRTIWLLRSAAPPRACCGCLQPGDDLILP
ncbi:mucin-3B [Brachyistius frenatus]|uniref:mucin-3B n=1 Tax=Brachyistius frenatus TaxID=100188 RepID=UPI0037E8631D